MFDQRLSWLKYFNSDSNLLVVTTDAAEEATVVTFMDDCAKDPGIQIVKKNVRSSSFVPHSVIYEKQQAKLLYIIKSRKSSSALSRILTIYGQEIIEEYTVLPSWKNPRWFVPKERSFAIGRMPLMIKPSRLLPMVAIMAYRLLKWLGHERLLCKNRLIVSQKVVLNPIENNGLDGTVLNQIVEQVGNHFQPGVLYTGSFGPLQKFTLELLNESGYPVAFAKIGHNKFSNEAIDRESSALSKLHSLDLKTIQIPKSLGIVSIGKWGDKVLIQELLDGKKAIKGLTETCIYGLIDLFCATRQKYSTPLQKYLADIHTRLNAVGANNLTGKYVQIRDNISQKLTYIANKFQGNFLPIGLSHGDFTRWNVCENEQSLSIIDWEEASFRAPGNDLFNLLFSEAIQAKKQGPDKVIADFASAIGKHEVGTCASYFNATLNGSRLKPDLMVVLYSAEKIAYCLWHVEQHIVGGYPEKDSFNRIIVASNIVFNHFFKSI